MSNIIRSLLIRVGVDLSAAQKNLKQMSKELKYAGRDMVSTGASLTKGLTLPILGAATAAVKLGIDFEDSMAKVATIADTSAKSISDLTGEVLSVSNATGTAATEINEALYQAISAGADTADAMSLVETAVKAAKGGFTDTTTAVDGLTSVLNAYGMQTSESNKLANLFLVTQNKGKTTFEELASSIGKVAPTAASVGVSIEDLLSSIASLTASGISTSESVTGLKAALSNIIKPTNEAIKVSEDLGIDFSATALKTKGLTGFLQDLADKTGGNTETMAKLFGSVEALNAVLTLTSSGGIEKTTNALEEMATNTTALDDAFNTMNDTVGSQLKISLNTLKNVGIELGDNLLPVVINGIVPAIKDFAQGLSGLIEKYNELSPAAQKMVGLTVGLAAAIGPLLTLTGKITLGMSALSVKAAAASASMGAGKGLTATLTAFMGPAGLATAAIVGVALVIGGLAIAINNTESETAKLRDELKELNKETEQSKKEFEDNEKSLEVNYLTASKLTDELYALQKQENKSNAEKVRMKTIVDQLNELYPDLNLALDEQNGLLDRQETEVRDLIAAMKEKARLAYYEERYTALVQEQMEYEVGLREAKDDLVAAQKKYDTALKNTTNTNTRYSSELMVANTNVVAAQKNIDGYTKKIQENQDEQDRLSGYVKDTADTIAEANEDIATSTTEAQAVAAEALESYETAYEEYIDKLETETEKHYDSMGGLFDEFEADAALSEDELFAILQGQIDGFKNWRTELNNLADRVGETGERLVNDELIAELETMGPKAAATIATLNGMTDEELEKYVALFDEKGQLAADAATEGLEDMLANVEGLKTAADESGEAVGNALVRGIKDGMTEELSSLLKAARRVAQQTTDAMKNQVEIASPSKVTFRFGQFLSSGLALGIKEKALAPIREARSLASGVMASFSRMSASELQYPSYSQTPYSTMPELATAGGPSVGSQTNYSGGPMSVTINIDGNGNASSDWKNLDTSSLLPLYRALQRAEILEDKRTGGGK